MRGRRSTRRRCASRTRRRGSAAARRGSRCGRPSSRSAGRRSARAARSSQQTVSQNFCFAAASTNQPSEAWKFWNGTIVGCAEFARRGGTNPCVAAHGPMYMSSWSAVSKSETSQSQPTPSRRARQMPAITAIADAYPPERSTSESPDFVGDPARLAGEGLPAREPLHHVVVAALLRARPGHPEAGERAAHDLRVDVLELLVREPELDRLVAPQVRVDRVDRRARGRGRRPRAPGCRRSSETLFLPRLNVSKKIESSPSWNGGTYRPTSPRTAGSSTLMISAPRSASCSVPQGPAPNCSTERMRTSVEGQPRHAPASCAAAAAIIAASIPDLSTSGLR